MGVFRVVNAVRVKETVGGKTCSFRSMAEYRWARYLQLLKEQGHIQDWEYEPRKFLFLGEISAPVQYTPDYRITEPDGTVVYQEFKGYHDRGTNTKLQRMAKHYPHVIMELVLQRMPKTQKSKGANRRRVAAKYVRRIIDAGEVFKQVKGLL